MTDTYVLQFTKPFMDCQRKMADNSQAIVALNGTLAELTQQPFRNPKLQTHAFKGLAGPKTFISDVGGRTNWRLIWRMVGKTIVCLLFGEHDIEERAQRLSWEEDAQTGGVRIVEYTEQEPNGSRGAYRPSTQAGRLFMSLTDQDLEAHGFQPQEIEVLRELDEIWELEQLEDSMRAEAFNRAYAILVEQLETPTDKEVEEDERREVERVAEQREAELERQIAAPASREHFAKVEPDELEHILSRPIEDWMIFLHPDQLNLTQRPFSGPARVRGGAGTGKTVVALHRAKHLADTYRDRILFTTYVSNLPPVFERLFQRLAPDLTDYVDFRTLHSAAHGIVTAHDGKPRIDPPAIGKAFWAAWRDAQKRHADLDEDGLGPYYYREEIEWIIKGRGLETLDDYLDLARTGRGTPLQENHRRAVWDLYERYEDELQARRTRDFNDLLSRALELVESGRARSDYRAVVIDEAQDLTEVGVRLAHALAGRDQRDGLFLVGDGQQSVYPGGYSLKSVGIDVVGRASILKTNYRNTRQILDAARTIVAGRPFDDMDEELVGGTREMICLRDGPQPIFEVFDDQEDHDLGLGAAIEAAVDQDGVALGDVAVLVPTNALVDEYAGFLQKLVLPTMKLQKYEGATQDLVKIGTYQRGKGLEFKRVFLPRLDSDGVGERQRHDEDEQAHAERLELLRRQLFVAMTRARDHVWSGWVGQPADILNLQGHAT